MSATKKDEEKPKVPFYLEHDQGMGVPARCRCGGTTESRSIIALNGLVDERHRSRGCAAAKRHRHA
jgi:hypothetical protein